MTDVDDRITAVSFNPDGLAPAIIQQFINQSRIADEYDRLFDAAVKASIPILNQNRLYTLTGIDVTR